MKQLREEQAIMKRGRYVIGQNPPGNEVAICVDCSPLCPQSDEAHAMSLVVGIIVKVDVAYVHKSVMNELFIALERIGMGSRARLP